MKIALRSSYFKLAVLLLFLGNLYSNVCAAQSKFGLIELSGKITNVAASPDGKKEIELSFPFGTQQPKKMITLAADGSFKETIPNITGVYFLFDGKRAVYFYMSASKKYNISYDVDHFKEGKVLLGGDEVGINRYYIEKGQQRVFFDPSGEGQSEAEFKQFALNLKAKGLQRVNQSLLPKELAAKERKAIAYEYLFNQFLFIGLRELTDSTFRANPATLKEFAINYNNEKDYRQYNYYQRLVYEYYIRRIRQSDQLLRKADPSYSTAQHRIQQLALLVPNTYIKNHLIAEVAMYDMKEAKDLETFYSDFKKYYTGTDAQFKKRMLAAYQSLVKLKKGTPSPVFVDYVNYKGGTSSLQDFKGKYVYIDLWATWCGNCPGEVPYLKALEKAYEAKNIVFVSISLDEDANAWAKAVKEGQMPGVQLLVKKPQGSFIKEYAVNGIPRYIFLDPAGNIIAYNAPRPSDEAKLAALFSSVGL